MIRHTYIFDNENELEFKESDVVNIRSVDDTTLVNPFVSGTAISSGAIYTIDGDIGSGWISPNSYNFVASGEPYRGAGEVIEFNFNEPRKLYKVDLYQNSDNYAVDYRILGDSDVELIVVRGSVNSGLISHMLSNPLETQSVKFEVTATNASNTSFHFLEISGSAEKSFVEELIPYEDVETLSATSVVEPVENLYDENSLTFWQSNNSYPQVVDWTFKEDQNISEFSYVSEDSSTYPTEFVLQTSLDGETYTTIAEYNSTNPLTSGDITINFPVVRVGKYVRWTINAGVGAKVRVREVSINRKIFPQIDENKIELNRNISNALIDAISISPNTQSGSAVISNAYNNDSKIWQSTEQFVYQSGVAAYVGNESITIDLGLAKTLDQLAWSNIYSDGSPIDYVIQGSADNITYTEIKSITGNAQNQGSLYFRDEAHTYRFFKLLFTKSNQSYVRLNYLMLNTRQYPEEATVQVVPIKVDKISDIQPDIIAPYPATSVRYILQIDGTKYWWNGNQWIESDGTSANSNDLTTLNNNVGSLDEKFGENYNVAVVMLLLSDETDTPIIESLQVDAVNAKNSAFIPKNMIRVKGFISGFPGVLQKPIEMQIHLRRSSIVVEGETIGYSFTTIKSDNTGYFDFMLPQTENANPARARYVISIPQMNLRRERYTPATSSISLSDWLAGNF